MPFPGLARPHPLVQRFGYGKLSILWREIFKRFFAAVLREPRHVEVLSRASAGAGHVTQAGRHEH